MAPRIVNKAAQYIDRTAIVDREGSFTYRQLLEASGRVAAVLLKDAEDLQEAPVAFLISPGFNYVAVQWGIWRAGGMAVPLSLFHPRPELEYAVGDVGAEILVADPALAERLRPVAEQRVLHLCSSSEMMSGPQRPLPEVHPDSRAMVLYTSGTTGRPKGVVSTHKGIEAQVSALIQAWEWTSNDSILGFLPLHHVHGIINVLTCALWTGASSELLPVFNAGEVLRRVSNGHFTLFMAVPTVYVKLIEAFDGAPPDLKEGFSRACSAMRLMVSGSAALPVTVLERWKQISGHVLLERYGMTEIGMALSNPLHGDRRPGYVGTPLPAVQVTLTDESGRLVEPGTPGEILVRGPGVFLEYWRRPDETSRAFRDGWFLTGDIAVLEQGYYRILGRSSLDIIKTGGYKVSALEVEEVLRSHPNIEECAVVGVEDYLWGQRVCAAVVLRQGSNLTLNELREWAKGIVAPYKVPRDLVKLDELPRNAMGKVSKTALSRLFKGDVKPDEADHSGSSS